MGGLCPELMVCVQYIRTLTMGMPRMVCEKPARTGDVVDRSTAVIGRPSPQRATLPRDTCASTSRETVRPVIFPFTITLNASAAAAGRGPASAINTRGAATLPSLSLAALPQE